MRASQTFEARTAEATEVYQRLYWRWKPPAGAVDLL